MSDTLSPELAMVVDFLGDCLPFDSLPRSELESIAAKIEVLYFRRGHRFGSGHDVHGLYLLRSGAVDIYDDADQLLERIEENESFRVGRQQQDSSGAWSRAEEDSLVYCLPEDDYLSLRQRHRHIDRFFHGQRSRRLRRAVRLQSRPGVLMRPAQEVMNRELLTVTPSQSIRAVAAAMTERRVSSALVVSDAQLVGIVTDRDLRSRVTAVGGSTAEAVATVMTASPHTTDPGASLFDILLQMARSGIHHLPVVDDRSLVGIITSSDILLAREDDPVFFVQRIGRQTRVQDIAGLTALLPNLLQRWVASGIPGTQIAHLFTAISDAVTQRLIELAEQKLGGPPAAYCWLCFGSQARGEQILGGDQDNALLIADDVHDEDMRWFEELAHFVCDGLDQCGYVYCPGGVMATNSEWRQSMQGWKITVDRWMRAPTPDAVMRVSIFFDLRAVCGDASLCDELQQHMLAHTSRNSIFIASLTENALASSPPLGLFRRFVVEHGGAHSEQMNLKKRGSIPIVELARVHALANGLSEVDTQERLQALSSDGHMALGDSRNLQDAFSLILQLRVEQQAQQCARGEKPHYYCSPAELPKLTRRHLHDAFKIVHDSQSALRQRYRQGMG